MIAERYLELKRRMRKACDETSRKPDTVRLLAISKGQSVEKIIEAYDLGMRDFGENYAAELAEKASALAMRCPEICWHYVGQIQSNKLRLINVAPWVHTLSEWRHAEGLSQLSVNASERHTLLQINLGEERHRGGVFPAYVNELYGKIMKLPGLNLCGLMTIAPISKDVAPAFWFQRMVEIKRQLEQSVGHTVPELSMGMSTDFEDAIRYGATCIRIGTLLFGERN